MLPIRIRTAAGAAAVAGLLALLGAWTASAGAATATVTSFDGTHIHVNFFPAVGLPAHHRAATVLVGPGWGSPGDTNANDKTDRSSGIPGLGSLRRAGFNVLTWDPRGFGASGGRVEIDSPRYEGRDVSALISWLARQPQALLDRRGDPRVGMAGGSYGGGIQFAAAASDRRIDAIVPDIAWHSLVTSLDKSNTPKFGWDTLLFNLGQLVGRLDPRIRQTYLTTLSGRPLTRAEIAFYASRGPAKLVGRIDVPTLLIQGTVDNLFTLQEAVDNYVILRRDGVPVHMLWFCGGHGICLTSPGNTALIQRDTIAWLHRYLDRRPHVDTGPGFEWVDQHGAEHTAAHYPLPAGRPVTAVGSGRLRLMEAGGSGPVIPAAGASPVGLAAASITPARAANAVNVRVPGRRRALVVGAPKLTLTYRGHSSRRSARVYAQVVDNATGKVLGNQVTPVPVTLDGARHTVKLPLEILAATQRRGEAFTLQITASTVAYVPQRATGTVTFSRIRIELPTVL